MNGVRSTAPAVPPRTPVLWGTKAVDARAEQAVAFDRVEVTCRALHGGSTSSLPVAVDAGGADTAHFWLSKR